MWPPMLLRLRIYNGQRRIRLWIPLILLWPLVVLAVLVGTPIALVAYRTRARTILLAGPLLLYSLASLRGLRCAVASGKDDVFISID